MSGTIKALTFLVLLSLVGYFGYQAYQNLPGEQTNLNTIFMKEPSLPKTDASEELTQFLPNMRFASTKLSYGVYDDCNSEKKGKIELALAIISNETEILSFYEKNYNDAQIKISCSIEKRGKGNNTFIAGEGGPSKMLNLSVYPLIIEGEVFLYETEQRKKCDYPNVEIHELMHVFGFDHMNDPDSILYPYSSCSQRLTEEIISEIKRIYSVPAKAELEFKEAEISKGGSYLNFKAEISNKGLIPPENIFIVGMDPNTNTKIKEFEMGRIEPGVSKVLTIENLKLPSRNIERVDLEIKSSTEEYFLENNKVAGILK